MTQFVGVVQSGVDDTVNGLCTPGLVLDVANACEHRRVQYLGA